MIQKTVLTKSIGIEDVETAANGREAYLKASNKFYDIILMDLVMPIQSGYEACV